MYTNEIFICEARVFPGKQHVLGDCKPAMRADGANYLLFIKAAFIHGGLEITDSKPPR